MKKLPLFSAAIKDRTTAAKLAIIVRMPLNEVCYCAETEAYITARMDRSDRNGTSGC